MKPAIKLDADAVYPLIQDILRNWHKSDPAFSEPFHNWLLLHQAQQNSSQTNNLSPQEAIHLLINQALAEMTKTAPKNANLIRQRFIQNKTVRMVALEMKKSVHQFNRLQRTAIEELATILFTKEETLRRQHTSEQEGYLPPATFTHFFGHSQLLNEILQATMSPNPPFLLAIAGLGGIGKSALADVIARKVLNFLYFKEVIWVRIESMTMHGRSQSHESIWGQLCQAVCQQLNPEQRNLPVFQQEIFLQQALKNAPHLIIVDNLEESNEVLFIISQLSRWTKPSRFIFTTRYRPDELSNVLTYPVDELPPDESVSLLRYEAKQRGLGELAAADANYFLPIIKLTGGNPLALKLVVGLATVMPLDAVLTDLIRTQPGPTAEMYRKIYWHAWHALSKNAQTILETMPLIADIGALPEQIQEVSELNESELWLAITELVGRSLLEARGTIWERRYGIHRLTESFLKTEIIHWPKDEDNG